MNTLFNGKTAIWIVGLAFLVLAAYLTAGIVTTVVEFNLTATEASAVDVKVVRATTTSSRSRAFYQPILDRNIFNSEAADGSDEEGLLESLPLPLTLNGTIARGGQQNLAVINHEREVDVYAVGDVIEDAKIALIEPGRVVVLRNGERRVLELPDVKTMTSVPTRSRRGNTRRRADADGITRSKGNHYEVDARLVDESIADMSTLVKQARIVPHMTDGQIDGFKIYKIKHNSLFRKLGLRNGDILRAVNGLQITSPEEGLKAFQTLRNERNVRVEVRRRGKTRTMTYTIR